MRHGLDDMPSTTSPTETAPTVRELALEEFGDVHGVTVDAAGNVWFGHGKEARLSCIDPNTGRLVRQHAHIRATAGTAFDGAHLWQIAGERILCIEPETGAIVRSLATPPGVHCAGMAAVPGALWIGDYSGKRLVKVSLATGEVIKELASDRFVTGVEWLGGGLWHGAWERSHLDGGDVGARLRCVDADSGAVLREVGVEGQWQISGTGADASGRLWCGGGERGGLRAVRIP